MIASMAKAKITVIFLRKQYGWGNPAVLTKEESSFFKTVVVHQQ